MSRITVVGAGFGALTAIRKLRAADKGLKIDVVAPRPQFVFYPGTIWIPTELRQPEDLVISLKPFFERMGVNYHQANATGLTDGGRKLITDQGEIENDGIIIASGGRFIKKLPGIEHSITPCGGIPEVVKIRDWLRNNHTGSIAFGFAGNPKEPSAMRGGPVFEFLFGIEDYLVQQKRRDRFDLHFFTPAAQPGQRLGPQAVKGLLSEMAKRNIKTHLGHKMKSFEPGKIITEGGEINADLILFMPGMTGNQWFDDTDLPRSEGGMLKADKYCRVEGTNQVYVAGDSGSFPGPDWLPKQAHMADLQAEAAVTNLLAELQGKEVSATYKPELVCIVDSRRTGMLVFRDEKRSIVMPKCKIFHWAKRGFEWWYLRQYR